MLMVTEMLQHVDIVHMNMQQCHCHCYLLDGMIQPDEQSVNNNNNIYDHMAVLYMVYYMDYYHIWDIYNVTHHTMDDTYQYQYQYQNDGNK
jgi:hypothetical protein